MAELLEPSVARQRKLLGFPLVDADISATANINASKIGTGVVDNTEFNRLNGITSALEEQGNKGAISGYAGLDASQKLLLTNFPTGTGLQVLRRNTGNTALEFTTISASDTPWTEPHDAAENNLINVGLLNQKIDNATAVYEMEANHTTPADAQIVSQIDSIDDSSTGVRRTYSQIRTVIDVPTNGIEDGELILGAINNGALQDYIILNQDGNDRITFDTTGAGANLFIKFGGILEYNFSNAGVDLNQNTLSDLGQISWDDTNTSIEQSSLDLQIDVATGGAIVIRVNNVSEYDFDATQADFNGNNLIMGVGIIQFEDPETTIFQSGDDMILDVDAVGDFIFRSDNVIKYRFEAAQLTVADPWNLIVGAATGTKIATAASQKLAFWGATPVVQPAHIVDADGTLADITTKFNTLLAQMATTGMQAAS